MLDAFNQSPRESHFRSFTIGPPAAGTTIYLSLPLKPPVVRLHFLSRSIPCLGRGCPLCPLPARPMAFLPAVERGRAHLRLLSLPAKPDIIALCEVWQDGQQITTSRGERITRITDAQASLHGEAGPVSERDIQESLCRAWGLPSPSDFCTEDAWLTAALSVIGRRL